MNDDIVKHMRAEEADLSRKLKAVRDFLAAYGLPANDATMTSGLASEAPRQASKSSGSREKVEIGAFGAHARRTIALAVAAMLTSKKPIKTRNLVEFIESRGHEVTGENKINALGALLARSIDINSNGKMGWSLVDEDRAVEIVNNHLRLEEPEKENAPQDDFEDILGADAGEEGAPTPFNPLSNPFSVLRG